MSIFSSLDADTVLLGHHLDDQGETLLLQLLRGAGPRGLSSMGRLTPLRSGVRLMRPWLDVSRRRIVAYAKDAALQWVEDESNLDSRFDRNFLRNEVLPTIESRFPGYRTNLFRSAQNMADLDEVARDMGTQDLETITSVRGISAAGLGLLSLPRALNALRCATGRLGVEMPSRDRLVELYRQVTSARHDASVDVNLGGLSGRVYRGHLVLTPNVEELLPWTLKWSGEEQLELPQRLGIIRRRYSMGRGLRTSVLASSLQFRNRCGGERLRIHSKQARKTLTHLFQQLGIPPWERVRLPMLCSDERVLWVPGVGYESDQCAAPDEKGIELEWIRGF
jgi:tRNA(Ile)-lysidine synthase